MGFWNDVVEGAKYWGDGFAAQAINALTGSDVKRLQGLRGPNGEWLASVSGDGSINTYDDTISNLVKQGIAKREAAPALEALAAAKDLNFPNAGIPTGKPTFSDIDPLEALAAAKDLNFPNAGIPTSKPTFSDIDPIAALAAAEDLDFPNAGIVDEAIANAKAAKADPAQSYKIHQGDTLWDIATTMKGRKESPSSINDMTINDIINQIVAKNNIKNRDMIYAGDTLDLSSFY